MTTGVLQVSALVWSDPNVTSRWLDELGLSRLLSKIGFPKTDSHALAYNSSFLKMTSGSGFRICDVVCRPGVVSLGLNSRSHMR